MTAPGMSSKWGSFFQQAVAGVEARLDNMLSEGEYAPDAVKEATSTTADDDPRPVAGTTIVRSDSPRTHAYHGPSRTYCPTCSTAHVPTEFETTRAPSESRDKQIGFRCYGGGRWQSNAAGRRGGHCRGIERTWAGPPRTADLPRGRGGSKRYRNCTDCYGVTLSSTRRGRVHDTP